MGAKTWMVMYADGAAREALTSGPKLDRDATTALARKLFPDDTLEPLSDGTLLNTCPPDKEIAIARFPGLAIVAAREFGIDRPSTLPRSLVQPGVGRSTCLHAMHSVVDWFAYAIWNDGALRRSLSLSPDSGVLEDIGPRLPFEEPYWRGEHPAVDPEEDESAYPLPFHPLELGEAALLELFGYQLEGAASHFDPEDIPLMRFKRSRSSWKRWFGAG
jgi:hypothetical protein